VELRLQPELWELFRTLPRLSELRSASRPTVQAQGAAKLSQSAPPPPRRPQLSETPHADAEKAPGTPPIEANRASHALEIFTIDRL